jgi:hypothetical protein
MGILFSYSWPILYAQQIVNEARLKSVTGRGSWGMRWSGSLGDHFTKRFVQVTVSGCGTKPTIHQLGLFLAARIGRSQVARNQSDDLGEPENRRRDCRSTIGGKTVDPADGTTVAPRSINS